MSFDPTIGYGQGTQQVEHVATPPVGRKSITADFAIMKINNIEVGMVQSFSPREAREVIPYYELGNNYPVEYIPSTWTGNIDVGRLQLFKDSLFEAFQFNASLSANTYDLKAYWPSDKYGPIQGSGTNSAASGTTGPIVTTLADIQWPIDIAIQIRNPAPESNGITIQTFQECWITGYGNSFSSGAKVVMETCTFTFRNKTIVTAQAADPLATAPV